MATIPAARTDCEHGYHAPFIATDPVESDTTVEVNYICPLCRAIGYTVSWTHAGWQHEQTKRHTKEQP